MKTLKKINYNALEKGEMKMVNGGAGNDTIPSNGFVTSVSTKDVSCGDERYRFRTDAGVCYKVLFHDFCTNAVISERC
jgi:hypothetical protein